MQKSDTSRIEIDSELYNLTHTRPALRRAHRD